MVDQGWGLDRGGGQVYKVQHNTNNRACRDKATGRLGIRLQRNTSDGAYRGKATGRSVMRLKCLVVWMLHLKLRSCSWNSCDCGYSCGYMLVHL